ncbi:MAG: NUDIX domain-containing protein [Alphaproteobacteria bacterium]|nr:NUDIX domain-containing protein [Alphaproteobacteria bacterium]
MKRKIINLTYKILHNIRNLVFRIFNVKTIGARALVVNNDQVLLIKHTYQSGWYTIGGGVKKNESTREAIVRELLEEVGVIPLEAPHLFAVYHNNFEKRDDFVAFYIVKKFDIKERYSPEIADKKWFCFHDLPLEITPSTRRRIEEFLDQRQKSDRW